MKGVRDAIAGARGLMSDATFDPWSRICFGDREGFVSRYTSLFKESLTGKKKSYSKRVSETVRRDHQSSVASASTGLETASASGFSVRASSEMQAVAGPSGSLAHHSVASLLVQLQSLLRGLDGVL